MGKGIGRIILHEGLGLLRRRDQPEQIEVGPPQEYSLFSPRVGRQALLLELGQDEAVEIPCQPIAALDLGNRRLFNRLKGPVLSPELIPVVGFLRTFPGNCKFTLESRPGSSRLHPLLEYSYLLGRQGLLGRHRHVLVAVAHRLDDQAFLQVARNKGWPGIAPSEHSLEGSHDQPRLGFLFRLSSVATEAIFS